MFSLGIIIIAIAVGNLYSPEAGWIFLGVGLILAAIFETLTGKDLE